MQHVIHVGVEEIGLILYALHGKPLLHISRDDFAGRPVDCINAVKRTMAQENPTGQGQHNSQSQGPAKRSQQHLLDLVEAVEPMCDDRPGIVQIYS